MEHIAIMKKSWGFAGKILDGRKKIESRWYSAKYKPWDSIQEGETVYFKNSGEPVKMKARVAKVLQFRDMTPEKAKEIVNTYGEQIGITQENIPAFFKRFKDKRYCILVFLKNPAEIKPFEIDKTGFGAMSAWITVDDVSRIKMQSKI